MVETTNLLDKSIFDSTLEVCSVKVPIQLIRQVQSNFKAFHLQSIQNLRLCSDLDSEHKQMLFASGIADCDKFTVFAREHALSYQRKEIKLAYENYDLHSTL